MKKTYVLGIAVGVLALFFSAFYLDDLLDNRSDYDYQKAANQVVHNSEHRDFLCVGFSLAYNEWGECWPLRQEAIPVSGDFSSDDIGFTPGSTKSEFSPGTSDIVFPPHTMREVLCMNYYGKRNIPEVCFDMPWFQLSWFLHDYMH